MTSYSIEWHEKTVKNKIATLDEYKRRAARLAEDIAGLEKRIKFRQLQINQAKSLGKETFDPDRFLKNRWNEL